MLTAFTVAHVVISLVLIIMVLLQDSKGDASGLLGGGGGNSVFGATGASSFMVKATRTVAALFAVCCIGLAYLTSNQANSSGVFDRVETPAALTQPMDEAVQTPTDEAPETTGTSSEQTTEPEKTPDAK